MADTLLADDDSDLGRRMVGDALVIREGSHYRIESGGDLPEDPRPACDCGEPLDAGRCRSCGRTYLQ